MSMLDHSFLRLLPSSTVFMGSLSLPRRRTELISLLMSTNIWVQNSYHSFRHLRTPLALTMPVISPVCSNDPPIFERFDAKLRHINTSIDATGLGDNTRYGPSLRDCISEEIAAQAQENAGYSLYGHEVSFLFYPSLADGDDGAMILSFHVPGLRENSPYLEEGDGIEMRYVWPVCFAYPYWCLALRTLLHTPKVPRYILTAGTLTMYTLTQLQSTHYGWLWKTEWNAGMAFGAFAISSSSKLPRLRFYCRR